MTSNKSSTSVVSSCTLANNIADTRNYKTLPDLAVFDSTIDLSCPILFCFFCLTINENISMKALSVGTYSLVEVNTASKMLY